MARPKRATAAPCVVVLALAILGAGCARAPAPEIAPAEPAVPLAGQLYAARAALGAGELDAAESLLEAANAQARAALDWRFVAVIEGDIGQLRVAQGRAAAATACYQRSAEAAERAGLPGAVAIALANAGRAALDAGDADLAGVHLEAAEAHIADPHAPEAGARLRIQLAESERRLAATGPEAADAWQRRARANLEAAAALASARDEPALLGHAQLGLARFAVAEGRGEDAVRGLQDVEANARVADDPLLGFEATRSLAEQLAQAGRVADAIAAYRRMVVFVEVLRPRAGVAHPGASVSYAQDLAPAYREAVGYLLEHADAAGPGPATQQRLVEARQLVEQSRVAELDDYFGDACVEEARAATRRIDTRLAAAAVLYPVLLPDRVELLVSLPDGRLERRVTRIDRAELDAEIRRFRQLVEKRTTREYLRPARRLFDVLVRPALPLLAAAGVETLIFVPDGPLRTIPLAALHDGEHFVVERFAVAVTPGIELTEPRPLDRARMKALYAGLSESVDGAAPLPDVPEELRAARALIAGTLLLDDDFSRARFDAALERTPYRLIHLATHGEFMADPSESYLLAHDGRMKLGDFGDRVSRFAYRDAPLELLVLSACETAAGSEAAALGLAGMAVRAGARSVIGSLWLVNDAAATRLLGAFYAELAAGAPRAIALQRAQQALIARPGEAHPGYWAAFILIGSWL